MPFDAPTAATAVPYAGTRRHPRRAFDLVPPIGWHGYKPADPGQRRTYYTGELPPAAQIADQVREPFGYTLGVRSERGAVLRLPPGAKREAAPVLVPRLDSLPVASLLLATAGTGVVLKSGAEMAAALGHDWTAAKVWRELATLAAGGSIAVTRDGLGCIVRIVASGQTVEIDRCPRTLGWVK